MKRLVRVDDIQITIPAHSHTVNNVQKVVPAGTNQTSMTYTYVMVPHYEELTWRQRRKRKGNDRNRLQNGGNLTLKL